MAVAVDVEWDHHMVDKALLLQLEDKISFEIKVATDGARLPGVTLDRCYTQVAWEISFNTKSALTILKWEV